MAVDLTLIMEDRPGMLAKASEALGKAGINIDGICAFMCEGKGVIHILVEDAMATRNALKKVRFDVDDEREVLVLEAENKPGEIGKISRRIGDAGVNIELIYIGSDNRVVIGADDLDKARAAV